jgi:hypothetical protein
MENVKKKIPGCNNEPSLKNSKSSSVYLIVIFHQDMTSLTVLLPIRRILGVFMNFLVWEHCTLENQIF